MSIILEGLLVHEKPSEIRNKFRIRNEKFKVLKNPT